MRFPSPQGKIYLPKIRHYAQEGQPGYFPNNTIRGRDIEPRVLKIYGREENSKSMLDTSKRRDKKRRSRSYDPIELIDEFFKKKEGFDNREIF